MSRRGWLWLAVMWAAVLSAAPCPARVLVTADAALGAGVEFNDNVDLLPRTAEEEPESESAWLAAPRVHFAASELEDRFGLDYLGEYRDYSGEGHEAEWLHDLNASLEFRRLSPFFLTVFERRQTVARDIDDPVLSGRDLLEANVLAGTAGLGWDPTPLVHLEMAYREARNSFPGEPGADEITRREGIATARRRWGPTTEGVLTAGWGRVDRTISEDFDVAGAGFGLSHAFSPLDRLAASVRWERRSSDDGEDDNWTGMAELSRQTPRDGFLRLSYQGALEDRFDGDTLEVHRGVADALWNFPGGGFAAAGVLAESRDLELERRSDLVLGPGADVRWMFSRWFAAEVRGGWWKADIDRPEADGGDAVDRLTMVECILMIYLGDHFSLEAAWRFQDNDSTLDERSWRSNAGWGLLTWSAHDPRSARELRPSRRFGYLSGLGRRM